MIRGRRVGTLTCGVTPVLFGTICMLRFLNLNIDYKFILSLWPVILILLGIETLISCFVNKEERIRFDGGSIALMFVLSFFAIGMAAAEFVIENLPMLIQK